MKNASPRLLVIAGPTACGKSDLAVEISETTSSPRAEIINFDSVQFFASVEIGAAKPSPELLARARHHLVGHVPEGEDYTAGNFRRDALHIIEEREKAQVDRFIAVGGSGFYIQALEKGMYDVPASGSETRAELEAEIAANGAEKLHRELLERDPEAGAKIHLNDHYRIVRALEVLRHHGGRETLSEIRAKLLKSGPTSGFTTKKIGLFRKRDVLRQKVTMRVRLMMTAGFIEEVESLRARGLASWSPLSSVGYKEVQAFLEGSLPKNQLEDAIVTSTMQLAKRQMTWFRRDPEVTWFDADENWPEAVRFGEEFLGPNRV
ncbi:MAG TPA: tRNA (adenosine(37)-N6)-dimethylallyltransferase MiaA [Bdellovibrionales bacterium]|nr:tRNA (adenosine(37)-N6)-dimethylallyltransferase MiaA [Bdellovibrionales bacterium]